MADKQAGPMPGSDRIPEGKSIEHASPAEIEHADNAGFRRGAGPAESSAPTTKGRTKGNTEQGK